MAGWGLCAAAAFAALVFASAAAAQQTTAEGRAPRLEPSRAVGATHNCADYYPEVSRRRSQSGDVLIRYDVAADGRISNVTVAKSSGFVPLDWAAAQCVSQHWRNTPAMRGGKPVASPGHLAIIRFSLTDSDSVPFDNWGLLLWSIGTLTVAGFLLASLRRWVFRARSCPVCHAGNRSIVPFVAATYCSSCGTKFAPAD